VAVFEIMPGWPGRVRIVIVALAAFAMVPNRQVTLPPASEHVPVVLVEDRYVTVDGRVSVTVTFVALAGPLFVTARE